MKSKIVIIILLAVLLIIFVLQNTEVVTIKFWFWDMSIPRALLLFVTFAIGLIIGLMVPSTQKSSGQAEQTAQHEGSSSEIKT